MKKLIALIMAMAMCLALVACGGGAASSNPPAASNPPASSAPAEGGEETPATVDPLEIKYSSTYQETETGGLVQKFFIDRVGELSGGAITVDISWGGTLFDSHGELDAVMDGVIDMIALGHMPHLDTLPYLSFPGFAPGGPQAALDYFNELIFNNAETSALIQGEAEAMGIKYLNVIAGGANAFCAKYEFTDLQSLIDGCSSFGNFDAAIFESLGLQVSAVMPPDTYDALNRGMIDATQMALSPMYMMSWYEPAPYWMLDETYTAGNMFTVNLDWWNGLTAEQQAIIQQAADETETYSAEMYNESIAADQAAIEAATGNAFVVMNEDDVARFWAACFEAKAADAMKRAETHNVTEGMHTILEVAAQFTNYAWEG